MILPFNVSKSAPLNGYDKSTDNSADAFIMVTMKVILYLSFIFDGVSFSYILCEHIPK